MVRREWIIKSNKTIVTLPEGLVKIINSPAGKTTTSLFETNVLLGIKRNNGWNIIISDSKTFDDIKDNVIAKIDGINAIKIDKISEQYMTDDVLLILSGTPRKEEDENVLLLNNDKFTVWVEQEDKMKVLRVLG